MRGYGVTGILFSLRPPGCKFFEFYVFTDLICLPTSGASGGDIFLCVKKDIEERHAKGLRSRPLDSGFLYGGMRGDVRTPYEFALVQFTRFRLVRRRAGGVRFARLRRKAKHHLFSAISLPQALLPPDSCVLLRLRQNRWHSKNNQRFANFAVRWLRECSDLSWQRSTQRQGNKRSAAADLIASYAPLRDGTHKVRQNTVPH